MPPRQRPFAQVDVFTATPYLGNPLAVVLDGTDLSEAQMRQFAAWTNLSETTFVLPPTPEGAAAGADYRVRIFTPESELPFAGHPTLGTCHAWLQAGHQPRQQGVVVQECGVGLVTIGRRQGHWAFAAPSLRRSAPDAAYLQAVLQALGVASAQMQAVQMLDNGPHWLGLLLDNPETVLALQPDHAALRALHAFVGVAALYPHEESSSPGLIGRSNREARAFVQPSGQRPSDARSGNADLPHLEVRAFVGEVGVSEDPVTGSLNASLAQWLIADGHLPERYTAAQGTCLNRAGRVFLERDPHGQVWVGGHSVTCIQGTASI
ncbi:PhzF family phenazine biosynthesis protein [Curvibacter sp. CHRR-16]|uniref:PhzF family phenazine biosynthesis protein n=1 Tax=Curvibacter sp. CHRR-16 TaxID=2835872 RepID=UPI001BD9A4A0|nr:PhzF family phenazine biosynthesis protein [Curvibacter sp. CHRR-16]MBT0569851.1 PhzF family phenazine biosynthesis protein [Curvibacter sp. CHRR-16]